VWAFFKYKDTFFKKDEKDGEYMPFKPLGVRNTVITRDKGELVRMINGSIHYKGITVLSGTPS
jgi:hypothetical protein